MAAAPSGRLGGRRQRARHALVGLERAGRRVPGGALARGVERRGVRAVRGAALPRRGAGEHDRARERVAERDLPGRQLDQPGRLRRLEAGHRPAELARRGEHRLDRLGVGDRRRQQRGGRASSGQRVEPAADRALEPVRRSGPGRRPGRAAGAAPRRRPRRARAGCRRSPRAARPRCRPPPAARRAPRAARAPARRPARPASASRARPPRPRAPRPAAARARPRPRRRAAAGRRTRAPTTTAGRASGRRRRARPPAAARRARRAGRASRRRRAAAPRRRPARARARASSARACGAGSRPSSPSAGRSSSDRPAKATSTSDSTPRTRSTVASPAGGRRVLEQRALADPGLAAQHQHAARARAGLGHQPLDALALRLAPQQHGAILRAVRAAVAATRSRAGGRRRRRPSGPRCRPRPSRRAGAHWPPPARRATVRTRASTGRYVGASAEAVSTKASRCEVIQPNSSGSPARRHCASMSARAASSSSRVQVDLLAAGPPVESRRHALDDALVLGALVGAEIGRRQVDDDLPARRRRVLAGGPATRRARAGGDPAQAAPPARVAAAAPRGSIRGPRSAPTRHRPRPGRRARAPTPPPPRTAGRSTASPPSSHSKRPVHTTLPSSSSSSTSRSQAMATALG